MTLTRQGTGTFTTLIRQEPCQEQKHDTCTHAWGQTLEIVKPKNWMRECLGVSDWERMIEKYMARESPDTGHIVLSLGWIKTGEGVSGFFLVW